MKAKKKILNMEIVYDSGPDFPMEEKLEKLLKKYGWRLTGAGTYVATPKIGQRDISYEKEIQINDDKLVVVKSG